MAGIFTKAYWNTFILYEAFMRRNLSTQPLRKTQALQDRRVRRLVEHAYKTVPFYRESMLERGLVPRDIGSASDLSKLPIVKNDDIIDNPDAFVSSAADLSRCLQLHTTGSTGRSKTIWHTPESLFYSLIGNTRRKSSLCNFVGKTRGFREMSILTSDGSASILRGFYEDRSWVPRRLDRDRRMVGIDLDWRKQVEEINTFRPHVISGYGDHLGVLFRRIWSECPSTHLPRVIGYGGSNMSPDNRRLIEEDLQVPVISCYHSTEALQLALECPHRKGLHIQMDQAVIRAVDEQGRPVPKGRPGFALITNLVNRATVLLNYRLGDLVTLREEQCSCGSPIPMIRIDGRSNGILIAPDGRILGEILESLPDLPQVRQKQLIQEGSTSFRLRLSVTPEADRDLLSKLHLQALRDYIADDVQLQVEYLDRIPAGPGGKTQALVRLLDKDPALS